MANRVKFDVVANASARGFNEVDARIAKTAAHAEKSSRQVNLLGAAIAGLGPAVVPLGAVAAGAFAGLGASAGTAMLGVLGIRDAMKEGTVLGQRYQAAFKPITAEFDKLKQTAAAGMFQGINAGIKSLQPLFPVLNRDVALMSTQLGQIAGNIAPGLVSLFNGLNPLFATFGEELVRGSEKFQQWAATSDSVGRFVAYAQTQLPLVEQTLASLATTASHLVQGFAPFGSTSLMAIKLFSQAINLIPVDVLQRLVPLLTGAYLGFQGMKAARNAADSLGAFSAKLGAASDGSSRAGKTVGLLGKAVGFLGPVGMAAGVGLGVLSAVTASHSQKAAAATKQVNDYTEALRASNGVVDESIREMVAKNLQDADAFKAANQLGISLYTLTDAALGNKDALAQVNAVLAQYPNSTAQTIAASGLSRDAYEQQFHAAGKVSNALRDQGVRLDEGKVKQRQMAAATLEAAAATKSLSAAQIGAQTATRNSALSLGITTDAYTAAKDAADKHAASTQNATLQMRIEGDTAGLLKQALDGLAGKTLSVSEADLAWNQSLTNATSTLKENGRTIDITTAKGQANRSAIDQMARSNQGLVTAQLQGVKSGGEANRIIDAANKTFRENAARIYGAGTEAYKYAIKVGQIPHVASTDVRFNDANAKSKIADLNTRIRNLPARKDVNVYVAEYVTGHTPGGTVWGGRLVQAQRGYRVPGYGGGDVIPALLEPGETVVPKRLTPMIAPWAKAMGIPGFAAGAVNIRQNYTTRALLNALKANQVLAPFVVMKELLDYASAPAAGSAPAALQNFAFGLFPSHGWDSNRGYLNALVALWNGESGWRWDAENPSSGAYGIPQALPASKMASNGADWRTNPATQIRWGLDYIQAVYGNPLTAWNMWQARSPHWYGKGLPPTVFRRPTLIGVGDRGPETVSVTRGAGAGVHVENLTVNALDGTDAGRKIVRVLERWTGGGGKIAISRAIV